MKMIGGNLIAKL